MATVQIRTDNTAIVPIDLLKGHNPSVYQQAGNNQLENLFISNNALFPTAGRKEVKFNGQQIEFGQNIRGMFSSVLLDAILIVADDLLFTYDPTTGQKEILNSLSPLEGSVNEISFAEGQFISGTQLKKQIAICEYGVSLYVYDVETSELHKVVLPQGVGANSTIRPGNVIYFDNFFIVNDIDTNRFYISAINDALTWNQLQYSEIRSKTVALTVLETQLHIFGGDLTQIFYNAGTSPFPFQPTTSISYEYGLLSEKSLASSFGIICWLAQNRNTSPLIVYTDGSGVKPISTENIDAFFIDRIKNVQDCRGYLYQESGHVFYTLTFFSDNLTLTYDFFTQKFTSIREVTNGHSAVYDVINFKNDNYAFVRSNVNTEINKRLYEYGITFTSDDGELVERSVTTDTYVSKNVTKPFVVNKLSLNLQQGTMTKPGWVNLYVSKDKGVNFNFAGRKELNYTGQTNSLLNFYNLGSSRFWTFKIGLFSLDATVLLNADMEITQ